MEKFTQVTGVAAPLPIINLDTDKIFPAIYLKTIKRTGLSQWLTDRYHLSPSEVAAVLGTAMRYEIAEVVDPQINIVAVIKKGMLAKIH